MSETTNTAAGAGLRVEIATLARDTTYPVSGYTLQTRDDLLVRRGGVDALHVYQDLARDGHTGSVLRKRRQAVIAREWTVEPEGTGRAEKRAAAIVEAALKRIRFDRACQGLLGAVLTGMAVAEVIWEPAALDMPGGTGTWLVPKDIKVRNPRRFRWGHDEQLRLLTREAPLQGIELPERKFITARFWAEENEDPYGRGLGHDLFWPVYFKRNGVALWNALIDKFGQPFVYAEYPSGTSDKDREELLASIVNAARDGGVVVPQGTLIKFLETAKGGGAGGSLHAELVSVMNAEISKVVLGETLTTEVGDTGSYAASQTHDGVRDELADADADLLSAELNATLLTWITEVNLPGVAPPKIWRRKVEAPDLAATAQLDKTLFDMGWERDEASLTEIYGPGYRRKPKPAPLKPQPGAEGDAPEEAGDPAPEFAEPTEAPELLADRLARDAAVPQGAILDAIRSEVALATSFADLEERLLRLSAAMPLAPLAEALDQAFAVAHLAGRADVQDESAS